MTPAIAIALAIRAASSPPSPVPGRTSRDQEPATAATAITADSGADAVSRASLTDGFGLEAADGRFGMTAGFLGSFRYEVTKVSQRTSPGFRLALARPYLRAHLWGKRLTFLFQPEFAGTPTLLDATATVNVYPAFSVQLGQFRPWFTRGFPTGLPALALPDRGRVLDTFRVDRDLGATVLGRALDGRFEYYVGVFNGEGRAPTAERNPDVLITARVVGAPLGPVAYDQTSISRSDGDDAFRIAFAANATTNEVRDSSSSIDPASGEETTLRLPDRRDVTYGGDVVLSGWRIYGQAEAFARDSFHSGVRDARAWGAYGLLSALLVPRRLDIVMRAGALRPNSGVPLVVPIEPGLNLYLAGNHAKLQFRYACSLSGGSSGCAEHRGTASAQLLF